MAQKSNTTRTYGSSRGQKEPNDFTVSEWNGLVTSVKDITELPNGATPDSLNWITGRDKDHIELRRGFALLGKTRRNGNGRISGLGVAQRADATQVPFFTFAQKILEYNVVQNDTIEVSTTNILPLAASGEDVSIMPYQNTAGAFAYITSPNSSIYKIATANPTTVLDLNSRAFRGMAKIDTNRMFMWQRKDAAGIKYNTPVYIGVSDQTSISAYTQKTAQQVGTGDAATTAFSGTLPAVAGVNSVNQTLFSVEIAAPIAAGQSITAITQAVQSVLTVSNSALFSVGNSVTIQGVVGMTQINGLIGTVLATPTPTTVTLSINTTTFTAYGSGGNIYLSEYFIDDQNGNMNSDHGGTGTINYVTGAFTVNFNTPPIFGSLIEAQYYSEDSSNGGVTDFTVDGGTKGKGKIFPQQDGGGSTQAVFPFDQVQYTFHTIKTWYISLGSDDTNASNLPYRSRFGIPYFRAGFPTPDGIVVMDVGTPSQPKVKILQVDSSVATNTVTVVPISVSDMLDLTPYGYNFCVIWRWGDYDVMACENVTNGVVDSVNTLFFIRNIVSGQWDLLNYPVSCLEEYNGTLIAGSSLSNNVFTLFSGFDDDSSLINNYWKSKQFDLGVEGIKKFNRMVLRGLIQNTQNIDVYVSFDSGNFIKIFTVKGNGSYVNTGAPTVVGANTVGSNVVGGGSGLGPTVTAYPYEVEFEYSSDIFEYVQAEFVANNIGFAQINEFTFKDIRYKGKRLPVNRIVAST